MSLKLYDDGDIQNIANAIRNKNGSSTRYKASQMASAVNALTILKGETKTITPTTSQQIITPSSGKNAITQATVKAVTSSIDSNIKAENIKKNISILGVTGTFEGSGGGGGEVISKGVFFLDYEGEIVEAWETSTVASKTALPNNPAHTGVAAMGWNWTLSQIKNYISNNPEAKVYVGQMYGCPSFPSMFDITLTKKTGKSITWLPLTGYKNWGDGTRDYSTSHTYTDYGKYTIGFESYTLDESATGLIYRNAHSYTEIRLSASYISKISAMAFYGGVSLKNVAIPSIVTSIGRGAFFNCCLLKHITIPSSVTSISEYMCSSCYSLRSIAMPSSITSIDSSAFAECRSLTNITIPPNVTSIGNAAFYNCYSITEYDFTACTSVPTLGGSDVFTGINGICKIVVPDNLYDSWKTATNWSTYADYIYKASEV